MKSSRRANIALVAFISVGIILLLLGVLFFELRVSVHSSGEIHPKAYRSLYVPIDALLEQRHVSPGDVVKKGDLLMSLSSRECMEKLRKIETEVSEVSREIDRAQLILEEMSLTGGDSEYRLAKKSMKLIEEMASLEAEISKAYEQAVKNGGLGSLRAKEKQVSALEAQRVLLANREHIEKVESGMLEIKEKEQRSVIHWSQKRLAALEREREALKALERGLSLRAPMDGVVTDVYIRDVGMKLKEGEMLLTVADPKQGYCVKTYIDDRNVDLVKVGCVVLMESHVYMSKQEGYMRGRVTRVVMDAESRSDRGYEVLIDLDEYPHEPVLGSRLDVEIMLKDYIPMDFLDSPSLRQSSSDPVERP